MWFNQRPEQIYLFVYICIHIYIYIYEQFYVETEGEIRKSRWTSFSPTEDPVYPEDGELTCIPRACCPCPVSPEAGEPILISS